MTDLSIRKSGIVRGLLLGGSVLLLPPDGRAAEPERFSLSMFHFNVQYVAGGMEGFPDGNTHVPSFDLDEATVEDRIVTESFVPLLDLLERHPTWKQTVELQGYMVEVLAARHPDALARLRDLVDAGQIELVSFHYADQLFLAYPRLDLERSQEALDRVLDEADLTLSPVTFCQEGQFGEGMATIAPGRGQTILGLPKNLFRYQHAADEPAAAPLYTLDGADVFLVGRGVSREDLVVSWSFFDDGELWSTNDGNPYLGLGFALDPDAVAAYEAELQAAEDAGFRIATIEEYATWVKEAGIERPPLPPMLDGTWQPSSTDSMFRWMGASGVLDQLYASERDDAVLTGNVAARHALVGAEALVAWADAEGLADATTFEATLRGCWRTALLGQVTDATGINPFAGEVAYGLDHGAQARACAEAVHAQIADLAGAPFLVVDTATGGVQRAEHAPVEAVGPAEPPWTEALAVTAPGREVTVTWEAVGEGEAVRRVTITASAATGGERVLEVAFPWTQDAILRSPALVDDEVRAYPLDAFDLQEGRISFPLANGLIGLADDRWLVQVTSATHTAVTVREGEPALLFRDHTLDPRAPATWVYEVVDGSEALALAHADARNVHPTLVVAGPAEGPPEGCACRSAPARAAWAAWPALVVGLLATRRSGRSRPR